MNVTSTIPQTEHQTTVVPGAMKVAMAAKIKASLMTHNSALPVPHRIPSVWPTPTSASILASKVFSSVPSSRRAKLSVTHAPCPVLDALAARLIALAATNSRISLTFGRTNVKRLALTAPLVSLVCALPASLLAKIVRDLPLSALIAMAPREEISFSTTLVTMIAPYSTQTTSTPRPALAV